MMGSTPSIWNSSGVTEPPCTRSALVSIAAQHEAADQVRLDAFDRRTRCGSRSCRGTKSRTRPSPAPPAVAIGCVGCSVISRSVRSPNGIGRRLMPLTMLKIVMLAPMPIASVSERRDEETGLLPEAAPGVEEVAKGSAHGAGSIKPYATKLREFRRDFQFARWPSRRASRPESDVFRKASARGSLLLRDLIALLCEQRRESVLAHQMRGANHDEAAGVFGRGSVRRAATSSDCARAAAVRYSSGDSRNAVERQLLDASPDRPLTTRAPCPSRR